MIRAIVFDFDGLLVDTETPALSAWQEIFVQHGAELTLETWIDCVGRPQGSFDPCVHLEELLGREIDRERVRGDSRELARTLIAQEALRPGVSEWIDEASEMGLDLGIASSSRRAWVEEHLGRLGVLERFRTLVCYEDVPAHKPDPAPYREATDRLDVEPAETIAVEDSSHGLQSAYDAGLWCVAVPNVVTRDSVADLGHVRLDSLASVSLTEVIRKIKTLG
ncbi:MAG: HAD-IA family hydrolase [Thermoanaerobaculia bacterium]|nr:HAD-IA family hydrolase [Thermoanaerobaculia bacterium]